MAGNSTHIRHGEHAADLQIFWIVNFAQINGRLRIHPRAPFFLHTRTDDDQANVTSFHVAEHFNQMIHAFASAIHIHPPRKEHHFLEGDSQLPLDVLFGFRDRRKILEVDCIIRGERLVPLARRDIFDEIAGIQNQSVVQPQHVIERQRASQRVRRVQVPGFRPERDGDAF